MVKFLKIIVAIIIASLCAAISVQAKNISINKSDIQSIKIYTDVPYPWKHNPERNTLDMTFKNRENIDLISDYINALELKKPPKNGDGGSGTAYYIDILHYDDSVETYIQYAYDMFIGDEEYYIENNDFEDFISLLYDKFQHTLSISDKDIITLKVGNKPIIFLDAQPFIDENDRTQIPIRAVAEMLDCTVDWNEDTETAIITREDGRTATLTIGSDVMIVNNTETNIPVQMDTAAIIKDERTYIPVRFVAEAMGLTVEWQN